MKNKLVWYVAYGSNILRERFMVYINGGCFREYCKSYPGCSDKTPPIKDKPYTLPYERYYGRKSSNWNNEGVAFIDINKLGNTCGRAYLITIEQFNCIQEQEGNNDNWYGCIVEMGCDENDIPYKTFTSRNRHPDNAPSNEYLAIIKEGMKELEDCK